MNQLTKVLLLSSLVMLAACGGGNENDTTPPSPGLPDGGSVTPPVTVQALWRYVSTPYPVEAISDVHFSKWGEPGSILNGGAFRWYQGPQGSVLAYDVNALKKSGLAQTEQLKISLRVYGVDRFNHLPASTLESEKRPLQINEQTTLLSTYLDANRDPLKQQKTLRVVGMPDTDQNGRVTAADIAFYDHQYYLSPALSTLTPVFLQQESRGDVSWSQQLDSLVEQGEVTGPFRILSNTAEMMTLGLNESLVELPDNWQLNYYVSCRDPAKDREVWSLPDATIDVPSGCAVNYAACDAEKICGTRSVLYFDNGLSSLSPISTTGLLTQKSSNLESLKKDPVFLQKYASILTLQLSDPLLKSTLICQLVRGNGAFCTEH